MEQTKATNESSTPHVFISYSQTDKDYMDRVRSIAEELAHNDMLVELDQWSVIAGDDLNSYMEKMVNDPNIHRVIIFSDRRYMEKADDRVGGVGTEATIITTEIYKDVKTKQGDQRFIPVVMERDPVTNEAFLPVFLKGRSYIDLSDDNHRADAIEQITRVVHDLPQYVQPAPGKLPSFYQAETRPINLGVTPYYRRALDSIKSQSPSLLANIKDFFYEVSNNLVNFGFNQIPEKDVDLEIVEKIKQMQPARDEILDVVYAICRYCDDTSSYAELHRFFEALLPYFRPASFSGRSHPWLADQYKFCIKEIFLYTIAGCLKFERFEQLREIVDRGYFRSVDELGNAERELKTFMLFGTNSDSIRTYNKREEPTFTEPEGTLLKERATRSDLSFIHVMQADFYLCLRSLLAEYKMWWGRSYWSPETNIYAESPFEVFVRAQSLDYYNKLSLALDNAGKDRLERLILSTENGTIQKPRWKFKTLSLRHLMAFDLLGTKP